MKNEITKSMSINKGVIMRTLFVTLLCVFCPILFSTTLTVNLLLPDNPSINQYHTILGAYNAAVNGDIIQIAPGDYFESISISKSITITGTSQNSTKIVTNGVNGFNITSGTVTIKNLYFKSQSASGIRLSSGCIQAIIRNCLFENCSEGINVSTSTNIQITNCIFRNCNYGFNIDAAISVSGLISNSIFHNNSRGINLGSTITSQSSTFNVFNSIFSNSTYGIYKGSNFNYYGSVSYNLFYSNSTNNVSGVNLGSGNLINIHPLLSNITGTPCYNYFPQSASPCIDAGNPDTYYIDLDGTRNDIGIFGGPYPWGEGKPVVLDIQLNPNTVQQGGAFDIQATGQTK